MGHLYGVSRGARMMLGWLARRPWRHALMWLAFLAPFFYISYGFANYLAGVAAAQGRVHSIVFEWERAIAFWQWTIFPYWSINFFYGLSLFLARSRHELKRHALRLLTAQVVAVSCFIVWPLQFTFGQPAADGLAGMLFSALRGFDQPFNQAPSLHIALAIILWDFYRRQLNAVFARTFLHVWTFLICASVLTTYQHHFIDIPTGALLGVVCVWFWPLERRVSMLQAWRLARTTQRWKLASFYGLGSAGCIALAFFGGAALWLLWPAVSLLWVALCYAGFGARGFQMSGCGCMAWPTRWLMGPYRAGAWLNARLWTRGMPVANEVVPAIWLGRLPSHREWAHAGKPAIVSLCAELQNVDTLHGNCVSVLDLTLPPTTALQRAALLAKQHQSQGRVVWICCALGFSRSAAAMIHTLRMTGQAADAAQARAKVQTARPQIVLDR